MSAQPYEPHHTPAEIRRTLKDDRSPKAIRAALPPCDHALFDQQYREALDQAKLTYDLSPITSFQERWWATAVLKAAPEEYEETIRIAERAMAYLERGESPPGAVRVDEAYKARLREQIERGA
ncbi:DUF6247 family protein [Sphaerimonospora thailandensis]|uniref:Uncharacterized protein n=1 Tax=Sphaerimonospora thailandensis TaxID=795644 RepID=A0A8J3VZT3_9ACTN|nr:DUF6247 family protein [Sphaerimonospora thailandensis]GIH70383.1 hypothetical protein Mth01_26360 [Sphaerimonospora thailandensis]